MKASSKTLPERLAAGQGKAGAGGTCRLRALLCRFCGFERLGHLEKFGHSIPIARCSACTTDPVYFGPREPGLPCPIRKIEEQFRTAGNQLFGLHRKSA